HLKHHVGPGPKRPGERRWYQWRRLPRRPAEKVSVGKERGPGEQAVVAGKRIARVEDARRRRLIEPDVHVVNGRAVAGPQLDAAHIARLGKRHLNDEDAE